jgi:hypothetical protein
MTDATDNDEKISLNVGIALISKSFKENNSEYKDVHIAEANIPFKLIRDRKLKCCICGISATHFSIRNYKFGNKFPTLRLYSDNNLFTIDHIIPVSLLGTNSYENLRITCELCNSKRKNNLTINELEWIISQDSLKMFCNYPKTNVTLKSLIILAKMYGAGIFPQENKICKVLSTTKFKQFKLQQQKNKSLSR